MKTLINTHCGRFLRHAPDGSLADIGDKMDVALLARRQGDGGSEYLIMVPGIGYGRMTVPTMSDDTLRWYLPRGNRGPVPLTLYAKGLAVATETFDLPDGWQERAKRFAA